MTIPETFKTAGGKLFKVVIDDYIDGGFKYGQFNDATSEINLARYVKIDGIDHEVSDEDMFRTYLHELFHLFQYYYNCETEEVFAQTFSNLVYEYLNTKDGEQ